ncbi:MAG: hypothetical protein QM669_07230 [Siphonobacter sp.]
MKTFVQFGMLCLIGAGFLTACQKNSIMESEKLIDYAEFKSMDEFKKTVYSLENQPDKILNEWEQQHHIVTLRTRFNQVVIEEEKNADAGKIPLQSEAAQKFSYTYLKSKEGGIEPNVASWKMMNVLNEKGLVKIGDKIYQFTYDKVKSIIDIPEVDSEVGLLINSQESDITKGIIVNEVTHSKVSSSPGGRDITYMATRSCESENDGYKIIAYEEVIKIEDEDYVYNCSPSVSYTTNSKGETSATFSYPCTSTRTNNATWFELELKTRTLKHSWLGWNNRNSTLQKSSGSWKLMPGGNLVLGWESGWVKGVSDPFSLNTYSSSNPGTNTSTFTFTFLITKKNGGDSNIRFDNSSQHNIVWDSYNCGCTIQ